MCVWVSGTLFFNSQLWVSISFFLLLHLVHGIDEDFWSEGKVLHRVHPHTAALQTQQHESHHILPPVLVHTEAAVCVCVCVWQQCSAYLGQNSQDEPGVCDHLLDLALVVGDDRHDVRDEVSHSGKKVRCQQAKVRTFKDSQVKMAAPSHLPPPRYMPKWMNRVLGTSSRSPLLNIRSCLLFVPAPFWLSMSSSFFFFFSSSSGVLIFVMEMKSRASSCRGNMARGDARRSGAVLSSGWEERRGIRTCCCWVTVQDFQQPSSKDSDQQQQVFTSLQNRSITGTSMKVINVLVLLWGVDNTHVQTQKHTHNITRHNHKTERHTKRKKTQKHTKHTHNITKDTTTKHTTWSVRDTHSHRDTQMV